MKAGRPQRDAFGTSRQGRKAEKRGLWGYCMGIWVFIPVMKYEFGDLNIAMHGKSGSTQL